MEQVFGWSHDCVLAHHWLFRSVTSFAAVRGYSGGSFISQQLTCCLESATFKFSLVHRGIQLEPRPRYVS